MAKKDKGAAVSEGVEAAGEGKAGSGAQKGSKLKGTPPRGEPSRLRARYLEEIAPQLRKEFNYKNPMQVPRLSKVVLNMGLGDAIQDGKVLDSSAEELGILTGQKPVITKARKGGANYIYSLLVGYKDEAPQGFALMEGMSYNEYFSGHQIAMPPPLAEDGVEYADGTKASVEQLALDVTTFLEWAGEPTMEDRKRLGIKVLIFLLVLTAMLYALKRRIWADLH